MACESFKMKGRFHGVFSLMLICLANIVALIYLFQLAPVAGVVYLIIILAVPLIVVYSYCAKCLCRTNSCSHVLPGKLARWFPPRQSGSYTSSDYFWTATSLTALFAFPQYWLWQNKNLFLIFWILTVSGVVEILLLVCRDCQNTNCIMCPKTE